VSPSFQESYGSVPFSAANKYEGLVFKRQFGTVFDNAARRLEAGAPRATALVQNIYISSWNEYLSQPQANPWSGDANAFSMGVPWDTQGRQSLWVDTWGQSISRDIEPSVHGGTVNFEIMCCSCLRVARLMAHVVAAAEHVPRARDVARMFGARAAGRVSDAACAVDGELCCAYAESTDGYAAVSALVLDSGADALVTTDSFSPDVDWAAELRVPLGAPSAEWVLDVTAGSAKNASSSNTYVQIVGVRVELAPPEGRGGAREQSQRAEARSA